MKMASRSGIGAIYVPTRSQADVEKSFLIVQEFQGIRDAEGKAVRQRDDLHDLS